MWRALLLASLHLCLYAFEVSATAVEGRHLLHQDLNVVSLRRVWKPISPPKSLLHSIASVDKIKV